jgi:hypothetical protein
MPFIIVAEVNAASEVNAGADRTKVKARLHSERGSELCFNVRGEFGKQTELTGALCQSLVDAGYLEFSIRHSY